VDVSVFTFVEQVAGNKFSAGPTKLDLSADGVGYTTSGGKLDDITARLDSLKQQIVDGKIKVPTTP